MSADATPDGVGKGTRRDEGQVPGINLPCGGQPRATMSLVNLLNIAVQNNPANFLDPFIFEITFECYAALAEGEHARPG